METRLPDRHSSRVTGIVLLLPLGLHMGKIYGFVPLLDGAGVWWMWLFFAIWLAMDLDRLHSSARPTSASPVTRTEELAALSSDCRIVWWRLGSALLPQSGPITSGPSNLWYPSKMGLYAFAPVHRPVPASRHAALDRSGSGLLAMGPNAGAVRPALAREIALRAGGRLYLLDHHRPRLFSPRRR